jgi:hypothetical protein
MLPIGAYRPRWFMSPVHIDPDAAVRAHEVLGARTSLAIHWGTFAQADDGELEPVADLEARSPCARIRSRASSCWRTGSGGRAVAALLIPPMSSSSRRG